MKRISLALLTLAVLGALGYQPNTTQSPEVVFAIRALLGLVPAAFASLALVIAWRFPITERVHRAIQDGIERHAQGEPAVDPLTGELLQPPGLREVDERTGWLLDHFSGAHRYLLVSAAEGSSLDGTACVVWIEED